MTGWSVIDEEDNTMVNAMLHIDAIDACEYYADRWPDKCFYVVPADRLNR